jgi:hypothetical protein
MKFTLPILFLTVFLPLSCFAQDENTPKIPPVYSNIFANEYGRLYVQKDSLRIYCCFAEPKYTLNQVIGAPRGTDTGIEFDFGDERFTGTLYVGLIPYGDSKHPMPVYRKSEDIEAGKTSVNLKKFTGIYDMVGWQKSGRGTLGYRVVNDEGEILYDGKVGFSGSGPFEVDVTIIEGPFINLLSPGGATISYQTNLEAVSKIVVDGKIFADTAKMTKHRVKISGLQPATRYDYTVFYGENQQTYSFRTAAKPGARRPFTFAYCSDSRSGKGGGERDIFGANSYIMKKILALSTTKDIAFLQFTGDMIDGYLENRNEINLQYANWKRAVEPFWHYFPIYVGMGNHETLNFVFRHATADLKFKVDRFPFDTESTEAVFAENFLNPENGPLSEDGAIYDPEPETIDFPSYQENVFYYTYDNVAMVVLNSDYFYTPSRHGISLTGGSPHGYIMDNQLKWLAETIGKLESDNTIDHIFITAHTPFFPNGGHLGDDMWYRGNNKIRPYVAGKPLVKGIIERRDELLDILVNKSRKTIAILTGDEHNYNKLKISSEMEMYPDDYEPPKLQLSRTIYQINNGAAGAPYYAQETTPWTPQVSGFTTQHAVVFFHINGKKITVEVLNPDTLEEIETYELR